MSDPLSTLENGAMRQAPTLLMKLGLFFGGKIYTRFQEKQKEKQELKQAQTTEGLTRSGYTMFAPKNIDKKSTQDSNKKSKKSFFINKKKGKKLGKKPDNNMDKSYEESNKTLKDCNSERQSRKLKSRK